MEQQSNEPSPAGLMGRAEAVPGLSMEILKKQQVVAERRMLLQERAFTECGSSAARPAQKKAADPPTKLVVDLAQGQFPSEANWTFTRKSSP